MKIKYLLIGILFFMSCARKDSIYDILDKRCSNDTTLIRMQEVINSDWDKMYIMRSGLSLEEIDEILGFKYQYFYDLADRIIFVKNDKVVYHEDEYPKPSNPDPMPLVFIYPNDSCLFMSFNRNKAVFSVVKQKQNDKKYFIIIPSDMGTATTTTNL